MNGTAGSPVTIHVIEHGGGNDISLDIMRTESIVAGTAILVLVPLLWGLLMAYGTEFVKRTIEKHRKRVHD
jgi:hypothetical protein